MRRTLIARAIVGHEIGQLGRGFGLAPLFLLLDDLVSKYGNGWGDGYERRLLRNELNLAVRDGRLRKLRELEPPNRKRKGLYTHSEANWQILANRYGLVKAGR